MSDSQNDSGESQVSTTPTEEQLRYPVDRLIAVMDTWSGLDATVRALKAGGFAASDIGALTGPAAAGAIDASTGRAGITDVLIRMAEWAGLSDEEMEIKDRYEQALREHRFVIGVLAPTDERRRAAEEILGANGGHFSHYFNRFSIERVRR